MCLIDAYERLRIFPETVRARPAGIRVPELHRQVAGHGREVEVPEVRSVEWVEAVRVPSSDQAAPQCHVGSLRL